MQIATAAGHSVRVTAWRRPCTPNDGQLLLTFTLLAGTPSFFSRMGRPLRITSAPPRVIEGSPLAYRGNRLAFFAASDRTYKVKAIWIMDATTGASYRVKRRGRAEQVFLVSPAGNPELWVFDGKQSFDRYSFPP